MPCIRHSKICHTVEDLPLRETFTFAAIVPDRAKQAEDTYQNRLSILGCGIGSPPGSRAAAHMTRCEAVARRVVVQVVALPTPPRLLSTALTMMLLRMSARNASYQALRTTSSRKASAAPANVTLAQDCRRAGECKYPSASRTC